MGRVGLDVMGACWNLGSQHRFNKTPRTTQIGPFQSDASRASMSRLN